MREMKPNTPPIAAPAIEPELSVFDESPPLASVVLVEVADSPKEVVVVVRGTVGDGKDAEADGSQDSV